MPELPSNVHEEALLRNRVQVFNDRLEAGAAVARLMCRYKAADAVVFGIPAGGVPVAAEAAARMRLPLDVVVVSKITLPWNTEAGYGAVAEDGTLRLNECLIQQAGLERDTVEAGVKATREKVRRRSRDYRKLVQQRSAEDATAIIVDDGLASGFTMRTAVQSLRNQRAGKVVVAVPTGHLRAVKEIAQQADEVYCVNIRGGPSFAVADAYSHWSDVSDDEVGSALSNAQRAHNSL